ncbi:MAG: DUF1003 domain-containing protein [bacterium]|nr:DUF1003 domain-containing protein [bacterium]
MENKHSPVSLEKLRQLRTPVRNINVEHRQKINVLEKLAMFVTKKVGTASFFLLIFTWTVTWLVWNTLGPASLRFDPFPAFVLWLFISNMIQMMLIPLIMIGQSLQKKHSEARAESDYEVNVKAEREIETILQHLENQNELVLKIVEQLEAERKK